jgi:signal transduction histidine kinase
MAEPTAAAQDAFHGETFGSPLRLALAAVALTIVIGLDRFASTVLDNGSGFLVLGLLVVATAWFAGTGAALGATILAAALGALRVSGEGSDAYVHLALFIVNALLITAMVAELRRTRRQAEGRAHEAQRAREQVEAANRTKEEFLATLSHELRTPLNTILGWVHLLKSGTLDADTAHRGLESIDRNVRLQTQLTSDLLDISKAVTGDLHVEARAATSSRRSPRA